MREAKCRLFDILFIFKRKSDKESEVRKDVCIYHEVQVSAPTIFDGSLTFPLGPLVG